MGPCERPAGRMVGKEAVGPELLVDGALIKTTVQPPGSTDFSNRKVPGAGKGESWWSGLGGPCQPFLWAVPRRRCWCRCWNDHLGGALSGGASGRLKSGTAGDPVELKLSQILLFPSHPTKS